MADAILHSLTASTIFDLRDVVAVVTGGGTGIGMMISSTLVANGATVYIIGPNQDELDRNSVCAKYNSAAEGVPGRGRMHGLEGDIRLKSESTRLAIEIGSRSPNGITVLFNNAGIVSGRFERPTTKADGSAPTAAEFVAACFDGMQQEHFTDVFNTNSVGPYWMTFAFLPLLEKWKSAEIPAAKRFVPQVIMTSSINGWTKDSATGGHSYPYLFSKSAIGHATASLANELLPLGIRVNGIAPGLTVHNRDEHGQGRRPRHIVHLPAERAKFGFEVPTAAGSGTARDMGTLALFLVANWFVNGETVLIDGGTLLKHPSSY
ncbi:NAD(P)-binding protein [Mycena kentingensis (nom. inval.)]|nr:NAD(P)-binding protein [Mycena kentingensis (nom. inval.)]